MWNKSIRLALLGSVSVCLTACNFNTFLTGTSQDWIHYVSQVKARGTQPTQLGQAYFALDDFGTLNNYTLKTNAEPWKLYSTALLLSDAQKLGLPISESSIGPIMQSYGFIRPKGVDNWNSQVAPEPQFIYPLGFHRGMVHDKSGAVQLEVANVGCAVCHAGTNYDSTGRPTLHAVLGAPNSSINIEGYIQAVYRGLKIGLTDEKRFADSIKSVYPGMSKREWFAMEHVILPFAKKQVQKMAENGDVPLPFSAGGPGVTNGVASLKFQVGDVDKTRFDREEAAFTSVPNLADRAFRSSLLYDGVYGFPDEARFREITASEATVERSKKLARIVAFFTIPTAGGSAKNGEKQIPKVEQVLAALHDYRTPAFPGRIDPEKATRGAQIYRRDCAQCHGTYSEGITNVHLESFPNRFVPEEEIGTEPARWERVTNSLIDTLNSAKWAPFARYISSKAEPGYVAPILTGLWISAPYLHNGSVPTLWHLMHPESRPTRFMAGGHRLDFEKMGLAGELDGNGIYRDMSDYQPWSTPVLYDTTTPGRSNSGHIYPFVQMSEQDKSDLLEYLKVL